jgi:uncharacterized membrane protein YfcA
VLDLTAWGWGALVLGAMMTGLSKTGLPGLGILVVVLFAHATGDVRQSAALLLPLLCLADLFGVWWFRRHAQVGRLWELAPWVLIGVAVACAAFSLPDPLLRALVAGVILVMVALAIRRRLVGEPTEVPASAVVGAGIATGFATTVANAAGPVMNLYLLARRLPKEEFLATGAWFFLIINLLKIPVYAVQPWLGHPPMFSTAGLLTDLALAPAVLVGALAGRWTARRIPQAVFDWLVLVLAAIGGLAVALR